jgi:hypothetical protein
MTERTRKAPPNRGEIVNLGSSASPRELRRVEVEIGVAAPVAACTKR